MINHCHLQYISSWIHTFQVPILSDLNHYQTAPNCYPASIFASYNLFSIQMNLLKLLIKSWTSLLTMLQWFPITRTLKLELPPESTQPIPAPCLLHHVLQPKGFLSGHSHLSSNKLPWERPAQTTLFLFIPSPEFNFGIALVFSLLLIHLLFVISQPVGLLNYWLLLPTRMSCMWKQRILSISSASVWYAVNRCSINMLHLPVRFFRHCQTLLQREIL